MRKVFISYARQNRPDVDQLVEHLRVLGCDTWVDTSLHGGQDWWQEILQRIADCDTFIPIISPEALNSTACRREFDWAESRWISIVLVVAYATWNWGCRQGRPGVTLGMSMVKVQAETGQRNRPDRKRIATVAVGALVIAVLLTLVMLDMLSDWTLHRLFDPWASTAEGSTAKGGWR